MSKELGIIICNFNKKEYIRDCLNSILDADFASISYDIIVVDNASIDGSVQMIKNEFQNVILIENKENTGGAGGFATGMNYAVKNEYSYICIQDNDTTVDKQTFVNLKNYLDINPKVGVVGATILKMDEPEIIQEVGANLDFKNFEFTLNYKDKKFIKEELPNFIKCDYVPACCFMTRLEVLKEVGVFDENYFIYWDDIDWSTRVRMNKYEIHAITNAFVWHKGGGRLLLNTFKQYYYYRNRLVFFSKYASKEEYEKFINKFLDDLNDIIYFANFKDVPQIAVTVLACIDDFSNNIFGKQDKNIYNCEQNVAIQIDKERKISFDKIKDKNYRNISAFLENYFENEVDEKCNDEYINFEYINHVKELTLENSQTKVYIDKFLNIVYDVENFIISYKENKKIFENVYSKYLKEKLIGIKKVYEYSNTK
jgi:GT2 family glycosyltransferase